MTVATFTHASGVESSSAFTATVTDSDGHTWSGVSISGPVAGVYTIKATQPQFSEDGSKTVTVTIGETGESPSSTPVTDSLTVNEPAINGSSATLPTITAGAPSATVTVATFTHANGIEPATDFTVTVNWGIAGHTADPATVTQSGNTYTVTATRPVYTLATTYTVSVSISEDNVSTVVTDTQNVIPGTASKLSFFRNPSNTPDGNVISPSVIVQVTDSLGNPVHLAGVNVTLSIPFVTLYGTLSLKTNANGQAIFTNLRLFTLGRFRLKASAIFGSVLSNLFTISVNPALGGKRPI